MYVVIEKLNWYSTFPDCVIETMNAFGFFDGESDSIDRFKTAAELELKIRRTTIDNKPIVWGYQSANRLIYELFLKFPKPKGTKKYARMGMTFKEYQEDIAYLKKFYHYSFLDDDVLLKRWLAGRVMYANYWNELHKAEKLDALTCFQKGKGN